MSLMIISLTLWILILIYNALYSFLPSELQSIKWLKIVAMAAATIILIGGIVQAIQEYRSYRFAYVRAKDGVIMKKKNFPWHVTKTTRREDRNVTYIATSRYGDASEITVKLDKPVQYEVYNAMDGVVDLPR
jgi:hypothetical protein